MPVEPELLPRSILARQISSEVANYRAQDWENDGKTYPGNYGNGERGKFRQKTTPVDKFNKVANNYGLYDMHGNLWEWCQDHWHDNYNGIPLEGSAWVSDDETASRILRGGSWYSVPHNCRSATRNINTPDYRGSDVGFRVVCEIPRTL
jgi:formylglycine-generating enzyme required for sulfatase activity